MPKPWASGRTPLCGHQQMGEGGAWVLPNCPRMPTLRGLFLLYGGRQPRRDLPRTPKEASSLSRTQDLVLMYVCDFARDSPRIPTGVCGWEGEGPLLRGLGWGGGVGKCRRAGPCWLGRTWNALCRHTGLVLGSFGRGAADRDSCPPCEEALEGRGWSWSHVLEKTGSYWS